MLIIPLEGKLSLRNPPAATLLIILATCFVFFFVQSEDGEKLGKAVNYYFESGLARIELPRYVEYLETETGRRPETGDLSGYNPQAFELLMEMQQNNEFMQSLHSEKIIPPGSADYNPWRSRRTQFNNLLSRTTTRGYGLVPAEIEPWMFVTMMFLHGGLWHLLGNMVFLWIVGCVLEMGLGRLLYILVYILGGVFAAVFYFAVHHNSYVPSIGASGAISALMGALAMLYGFTRIRVFFTTGFYFDYFRMPALLLLPFWLGKELLAFFLGSTGGVAYMAHAGGLIGGAALGAGCRRILGEDAKSFFEEAPHDPVPEMLEKAGGKISAVDFQGARQILQEILSLDPGNEEAMRLLFNIEKQHPDTERFREAAAGYLSLLLSRAHNADRIYDLYMHYRDLAGNTGLPDELYTKLASFFLDAGYIDEGKRIVVCLIRRRPGLNAAPALLARLIRSLEKKEMTEKAEKYRKILASRYPESQETRILVKAGQAQAPPI